MRRHFTVALSVLACWLVFGGVKGANAQCTVPDSLTNGAVADASQVMANFDAELACINNALPAGSTNSLQYNAGSGAFGAVGPLTNGQIAIGSTGNAPQAATLTAGSGITITNAPGSVTIAATGGGGGGGLYNQILSATPTSSGTGFTNWNNQGSATVSDIPVGIALYANSGTGLRLRYKSAPTPPYTATFLIGMTTKPDATYVTLACGWFNGTDKLQEIEISIRPSSPSPQVFVSNYSNPSTYDSSVYSPGITTFSLTPQWLRLRDDGTNVYFQWSSDGYNFVTFYSTAKSSGYLGSSGYSNLMFDMGNNGGEAYVTLMSYAEGS
jgi:hypothetical protein